MKILAASLEQAAPHWLTCVGHDKQIYAYLEETHKFHYSHPLDMDYFWDMELTYTEISANAAVELINQGIGQKKGMSEWGHERLVNSDLFLTPDEVLGEATRYLRR